MEIAAIETVAPRLLVPARPNGPRLSRPSSADMIRVDTFIVGSAVHWIRRRVERTEETARRPG
jgi:hypothetical protein